MKNVSPHDRILWILSESGRSMTKRELASRPNMKIGELDPLLRELERADKVRLVEIKGKRTIETRRGQS